jgi:hypothetical protein
MSDARDLELSEPAEAARGMEVQLSVPYCELHTRMGKGKQAILDECEAELMRGAARGVEDMRLLESIMHEPAQEGMMPDETGMQLVCIDGRAGQNLDYFVNHPNSQAASLDEAHVVALRFYTSEAYRSLNPPLRQPNGPHPFAATMAFIAEGLKRLRAVRAINTPQRLWRGMSNVRANIARAGGTEQAPLSCTVDLAAAARFASSREALVFLVTAKTFMMHGADLTFLSCKPHEHEVAYPPCTYLKPTGRTESVELPNDLRCVVVEVTPHVGS